MWSGVGIHDDADSTVDSADTVGLWLCVLGKLSFESADILWFCDHI
ncbi:hypothetical Protein YC6258_01396 [Gynuella sunshinyii YC6258]|uniref:Uncharacterized protein n=1 Tax=Gynuella sunshinyii YC6258 TaxID=1445510 RepID=A0A0C5VSZ3_9GAMM|nr:hypothetical Protein YC6258_01396 [Gynuella sunshinyii YC6258]